MWHSKPVQGSLGCGLWKSIRMRGDLFFLQCFWFEVGSDSQIRFWYDCWCEDQPSKMRFPVLF